MTDIIKADGTREIFNPSKLRTSLIRARASEEAADAVIAQVMSELREGMTTREIYKSAFKHLVEMQKPVAQRYSVRRAMLDMGPTGFPFEDFVAEVLRTKGFETLTRQTVLGGCVPHEMDVVAWNDDKLVMVEAKFHNGLGIKSDLKVALYVKARFDDLKDNMHHYGGRDRKLDEGWLITNTKFSSTALHYGLCQKLTMIGWNYPERGNLQDMIEENPELLDLIFKKHIEQLQ
ncbi:MAG TPA: ATP cone domain-containing protein [Parcubacteria group bacterium]|nr:ATP cone domain-containing protein [Parcubacteria group bacterium]